MRRERATLWPHPPPRKPDFRHGLKGFVEMNPPSAHHPISSRRAILGFGWEREEFLHQSVHHLAVVRHERLAGDRVIPIELKLAVSEQVEQKRGDVSSVHLAGVVWNPAGQIDVTEYHHAAFDHNLA